MKVKPDEPPKELKKLSWDEAQAKIAERLGKHVDRHFDFNDGTEMIFTVRALTPNEHASIESIGAREYSDVVKDELRDSARGGKRKINYRDKPKSKEEEHMILRMKEETIFHGLVEGPEGFVKSMESVKRLPDNVKTDLSDTIDELSELNIETEEGFRPVW